MIFYYKKFFDFKHFSFYLKLIVAVIPALVFGALLKKYIEQIVNEYFIPEQIKNLKSF